MEKKGKIIIGVVVAILVIVIAGVLFLANMDVTLMSDNAQVTLPNNYSVDEKGVANCEDTNIIFTPVLGVSGDSEKNIYKAIKANGKEAGYKNITNKTINGFEVFDFAAFPDKLKNVSSDREYSSDGSYSWETYVPNYPYEGSTSLNVDHYRLVSFIKDDKVNYLTIFTDNPNTSLYTPEIENIINSIADVEQ